MEARNIPPSYILGDGASNINRNHPLEDNKSTELQQCYEKCGGNNENLPPLLSGCSKMPVTAVITDDMSYCATIPADSSANNTELKHQGLPHETVFTSVDENMVSPQIDTNLSGKENSFQEDVEILLQACRDENSPSQTPDFYCDKLKSLNENYILELLQEKNRLDMEFQIAQQNLKENRDLTTKRLNTIENILCSSTVLNKFSQLQIDEILEEEKRKIQGIKSKLSVSVDCNINSTTIKDLMLTGVSSVGQSNVKMDKNKVKTDLQAIKNQNILEVTEEELNHKRDIEHNSKSKPEEIEKFNEADIEINRISRDLKQSQEELEIVKNELEDKINIIRQHAHYEQERILEISNLEAEIKRFKIQFWQTQNELKDAKKELKEKVQQVECEQEEMELIKEKEKLLQKLVTSLRNELEQTENEMEAVKKELNEKDSLIEHMTQHDMEQLKKVKEEVIILQKQLAGAENELTVVRRELTKDIFINQQKNLHEKILMEEHNKAKVNKLQDQLSETEEELRKVKKDLYRRSDKERDRDSSRRSREQDRDSSRRSDSAQHEQKVKKEFNDKEENEVKVLRNQLAATQQKLEAVTKELNSTVNSIKQNIEREQKLSEVGYREIRMTLAKKLGFTDRNNRHFESYMKEERCRGIVSDIRRLIKDKVKLWEEPMTETEFGSKIHEVTENEVHLVVAIACFLKVVPFSASTDFVYSFVTQIDNVISRQHVENLLKKFPTVFNEESIGAKSSNKNWRYLDLKPIITI